MALWALQGALQLASKHIINYAAAPAALVLPGLLCLFADRACSLELLIRQLALNSVAFSLHWHMAAVSSKCGSWDLNRRFALTQRQVNA